jgi:hypothetical protein
MSYFVRMARGDNSDEGAQRGSFPEDTHATDVICLCSLIIRDSLNPARVGFGCRLARSVGGSVVEFRKVRKRI